jgi:hypothetical protein
VGCVVFSGEETEGSSVSRELNKKPTIELF